MTDDDEKKDMKDAEDKLAETRERADELEKKLRKAEAAHAREIDHATDGGVI